MSAAKGPLEDEIRAECAALADQEHDPVHRPRHYRSHPSGVECIEIVEHMGFCLGNATKYLWRAGLKSENPIEDLEKSIWYIRREIERLRKAGGGRGL